MTSQQAPLPNLHGDGWALFHTPDMKPTLVLAAKGTPIRLDECYTLRHFPSLGWQAWRSGTPASEYYKGQLEEIVSALAVELQAREVERQLVSRTIGPVNWTNIADRRAKMAWKKHHKAVERALAQDFRPVTSELRHRKRR
jgi:hypothetical protein